MARVGRGAVLGALCLTTGALLAISTPARAATSVVSAGTVGPSATFSEVTATASCGTRVLSGGGTRLDESGVAALANGIHVDGLVPLDASRWLAAGGSGGAVPNDALTVAYALCLDAPLATTIVTADATGPSATFAETRATATCPPATALLSGGARATPGDVGSLKPRASYPSDAAGTPVLTGTASSWTAVGLNGGGGDRGNATHAYALCATGAPPVLVVHAEVPGPGTASTGTQVTAACPAGSTLLGGGASISDGFGLPGSQGDHLTGSYPSDAAGVPVGAGPASAWTAATHTGGTVSGSLTQSDVWATCAAASDGQPAPTGPTTPANLAAPAISGRLRAGATLSAVPGRWTGAPALTYAWLRCDPLCAQVAAGSRYRLTHADIGARMRVRESAGAMTAGASSAGATGAGATGAGATGAGASSAGATGAGAASAGATGAGATSAGAMTAGAMTAGASSAGATSAVSAPSGWVQGAASTAEIAAALRAHLAPVGQPGHLQVLRAAGGVTLPLKSLAAGRVDVTWRSRGAVIAHGRRTFRDARTTTVRVRLTAAGRRALRGATSVPVTAAAALARKGRRELRATRAFRVEVSGQGAATRAPRAAAAPRAPVARVSAAPFSHVLGGSGADAPRAIAVDARGDTFVTGETASRDFPVTDASADRGVPISAYVAKLDPAGHLVWATYLGGSRYTSGRGIAVDARGRVYVAGATNSTDFPVTEHAFQRSYGGGPFDAFVARFSRSGTLDYATFLGDSHYDEANAIAVDGAGRAVVTGGTVSPQFPVKGGLRPKVAGGALIAEFDSSGSALVYSTVLGGDDRGNHGNTGYAVAVSHGRAYVTGVTSASTFPSVDPLQRRPAGGGDAFLAIVGSHRVLRSTYLGTSGDDTGRGIAVQGERVYVTGLSAGRPFLATIGRRARWRAATGGAAVALDPAGRPHTAASPIAIDAQGRVHTASTQDGDVLVAVE